MTEKTWWDLIFKDEASQDDPDLRLGFACWLQDECDDPGAGYLWWCLDTSLVKDWHKGEIKSIRSPRTGSYYNAVWWWYRDRENYYSENQLPLDVCRHLTGKACKDEDQECSYTIDYDSRRAAEEDALRAWRKARSPSVSENEKKPAGSKP